MDIIFNPPVNEENKYIGLLVGELRAKGYRIHPLDTFFSSRRHFRSIKLIHLNWFENIDDSNFFIGLRSFLRKLAVIIVIRLSGKPLVWTMHNRVSHEKGLAFFSRTITRLLLRWSHRIIIHSRQSEEILAAHGAKVRQKAVYMPHPHFIGEYGAETNPTELHGLKRLSLLFTGMVKPYKNLELLIDVVGEFGDQVQLTIAGKAIDDDYRQQVAYRAGQAGNVTLLPYFIPDSEMGAVLAGADAVVLPYDLSSSLNSGTAILAFSYGKTVICPEIGTISDLGEHMADTFHYQYSDREEHRRALGKQIKQAIALKRRDPQAMDRMGRRLHAYVADAHDSRRIVVTLDNIYRELIKR
ncbi:glycosyltransferase family 4 protein [Parapedobacter deserti]|uniref:Glycosyltransferase family 4 protein n=1 Tax=Parapedobacter deserti TaxID=1912957 RepID=A0ABV7JN14_9SPHI